MIMTEKKKAQLKRLHEMTRSNSWRRKIGVSNKGKKMPIEHMEKLRKLHIGKIVSIETRKKMSIAKTGHKVSIKTRRKLSRTHKRLVKEGKNHLWKGGVSEVNKKIRKSIEFKLWRESVFKRDNWTCVFCKVRGGELHPDHIKPFCDYPELRFAIDNGRTLCAECHRKTDTWGTHKKPLYEAI